MGFYAGYALSLFGRPQDRLSHVLVQPDYESASEFFYPTRSRRVIEGKDKKPLDASEAKVTLADIPFVRMRHGLPDALLNGSSSFSAVVQAAGDTIGPPELTIDQAGCRIQAAGRTFSMRRSSVAMLSVFARRAMNGAGPISAPPKGVSDPEWSAHYLRELRHCVEDTENLSDLTRMSLKHGMDGDLFSMHLSRLQRALREALGAQSVPYLIDNGGTRPGEFRCTLPARAIHFQPLPPSQHEKQRKIS
jgi:hypothetical protein